MPQGLRVLIKFFKNVTDLHNSLKDKFKKMLIC
jgi:hypothetical protein